MKVGIRTIIDQYYITPGKNIPKFMEDGVEKSDRVLIICTSKYKVKSKDRKGGVGAEYTLINNEILRDLKDNKKFITLLREGSPDKAIPNMLQQYAYVNFINDSTFEENFEELIREIYKAPKIVIPDLGEKPDFLKAGDVENLNHQDRVIFEYDSIPDKMFTLNRWSQDRPFSEKKTKMNIKWDMAEQIWFDNKEWENEIEVQNNKYKGDVGFLSGFQLDHYESELGKKLVLDITSCTYGDRMATEAMLDRYPKKRIEIEELLYNAPQKYLENALPSVIYLNVMLISEENNFLAFKRSNAVATRPNIWTAGLSETLMLPTIAKGNNETLTQTAIRGISEEANLTEKDFGKLIISSMAVYSKSLALAVFAQVKVYSSELEVLKRAGQSFAVYEHSKFEWLPFNRQVLSEFIGFDTGMLSTRNWHQNSKLALSEAWRMKDLLY